MPYIDSIKANSDIFDLISFIDVGTVILKPLLPEILEMEAKVYFHNCNDEELKKRIPGAYVDTEESAKEIVNEYIWAHLNKFKILYCIRPKVMQVPIGYILLNSPIQRPTLNNWSIDFWMAKIWRGKKVMGPCLFQILSHMQRMGVPVVKAIAEEDNIGSLKILEQLQFSYEQDVEGVNIWNEKKAARLYSIVLS